MKKLYIVLTVLTLLLIASALADVSADGQWEYRVDYYGRAQLTDWRWETLGEIPDVVEVPAEIDGHKVTSIWQGTFTTEGVGGFAIVLPDSVIDVYGGFEDCGASRIVLGSRTFEVDEGSFAGCTAEVVLPADGKRVIQRDGFLLGVSEWNEESAHLLYVNPSAKGAALPELTQIGHHALDNWLTGEAITLPETVERIGLHEAYIPCANPNVIRTVEIDGQIWEYREDGGEAVLTGWLTMYEDVPPILTLPDELDGLTLAALGDNVFNTSESSLEDGFTLVIPEGVRTIEGDPFLCCHDAVRIEFPSTFVGDLEGCFHHVYAEMVVAEGNPRYETRGGYLIDRQTDTLIYAAPSANLTDLPAVKHYAAWSLANWGWIDPWPETGEGLTMVIPEGVESLDTRTLYDNVCISRLVLPDSLRQMESATFESCSITEIIFGNGITEIPAFAFYACYNLQAVTLPESVTFVGFRAFDPEPTLVIALNPDCYFETEAEYLERIGDDDTYWW